MELNINVSRLFNMVMNERHKNLQPMPNAIFTTFKASLVTMNHEMHSCLCDFLYLLLLVLLLCSI